MHISQFIILIAFLGFFSRSHLANINDLFIPEDGETIALFEDIYDDLNDEQPVVITSLPGSRKRSICLKQRNQRTIERILSVETPPPENACI